MELSIITPSYNYGQWISDALSSVQHQSRPAFEHVVIDDGSADDSVAVARNHSSDVRITTQANVGLAETLNRLLAATSGDWVGWLNADDFYLQGAFATLKTALDFESSLDVLVGDTVFVDEAARVQRLLPAHRITGQVTKHFGMTAGTSAFFIRRRALEAVGFRAGTKFLMDKWLFWQLWGIGAKFGYLPVPLGAMRRHAGQESRLQQDLGAYEKKAFREAAQLPTGGWRRALTKTWGRGLHLTYKVLDHGLFNEWGYRIHQGEDARWWVLPTASGEERGRRGLASLRQTQDPSSRPPADAVG